MRAWAAGITGFGAQFRALGVVCVQFFDGQGFGGATVDTGIDWLGVIVQVDGVYQEGEKNASEDLSASLFLSMTIYRLLVEGRVVRQSFFIHD